MKKVELEQLRNKYLAGETSLEEEKMLKEEHPDFYFSALAGDREEMNLDFEDFMANVEEDKVVIMKPSYSLWKIISSIAAAILILCIGIWFANDQNELLDDQKIVHKKIAPEELIEKPIRAIEKEIAHSTIEKPQPVKNSGFARKQVAQYSNIKKEVSAPEEEFFVEVNGVKITNEEEALRITEDALHLASTTLSKSVEQVEKVEYLLIEI